MGWSHPDISLEDVLKLFKGFVDILILASGFQSTGSVAHWDPLNIKRAFQWGLFFEDVLRRLRCSDDYQDSLKELDSALSEITSNPLFPQGLAHLSADSLRRARDIVLEHLIHALPLREAHLRAIATASIEMDIDKVHKINTDSLDIDLDKLVLHNPSKVVSSQDIPNRKAGCDFTKFTIRELMLRQSRVSCISSAEAGVNILYKNMVHSDEDGPEYGSFKELLKLGKSMLGEEQLIEYHTRNQWKVRALSYFLDKNTLRLVAGASMIFSSPSPQWIKVFESLNTSPEFSGNDINHIFEILLLGCVARKWSSLADTFMSVSYDSLTIMEQYHEVCSLLVGRSKNLHASEKMINEKEKNILEHLGTISGKKLHLLWNLPPVLAAVAIPSWSPLFRLYLSEVNGQLKGDSSAFSCCSCVQDKKDHTECEVAERIWCLYSYHVHGSRSAMS